MKTSTVEPLLTNTSKIRTHSIADNLLGPNDIKIHTLPTSVIVTLL